MKRVFNFSAGPATLPLDVLKEAQEELLDFEGTGMSIMEMSHRTKPFEKVLDEAISDLRDLLKIPENYKVIFPHVRGREEGPKGNREVPS